MAYGFGFRHDDVAAAFFQQAGCGGQPCQAAADDAGPGTDTAFKPAVSSPAVGADSAFIQRLAGLIELNGSGHIIHKLFVYDLEICRKSSINMTIKTLISVQAS